MLKDLFWAATGYFTFNRQSQGLPIGRSATAWLGNPSKCTARLIGAVSRWPPMGPLGDFACEVEAAKRGVAAVKANARQFAANVLPIIEEIERAGITSHNAIAAKLNERNVRTARGGKWTHVQVGAVLRPFAEAAAAL